MGEIPEARDHGRKGRFPATPSPVEGDGWTVRPPGVPWGPSCQGLAAESTGPVRPVLRGSTLSRFENHPLRSGDTEASSTRLGASVDPTEAREARSCRVRGMSEGLDGGPERRDRGNVLGVAVPPLSVQRLRSQEYSITQAASIGPSAFASGQRSARDLSEVPGNRWRCSLVVSVTACWVTVRVAGAEDRPTRGRDPSAQTRGAKTDDGGTMPPHGPPGSAQRDQSIHNTRSHPLA